MLPATLQEHCVQVLLSDRRINTLDGCISLASQIEHFQTKTCYPLLQLLTKKLEEFFPYLIEKYNLSHLKEIAGEIDWDMIAVNHQSMETEKRRFQQMKGTVLERVTPNIPYEKDSPYYPLELLVEGVQWPGNVDPANRERFLSDDDFFSVFDMTKSDFQRLPLFKRKLLKQENKLF